MEKTSCVRFYYFSLGVASFTWNPHYKKCMMDEKTDFRSERVNRASINSYHMQTAMATLILHSPRATKGCHTFSMEKLYILLAPLVSLFSHSPFSEEV